MKKIFINIFVTIGICINIANAQQEIGNGWFLENKTNNTYTVSGNQTLLVPDNITTFAQESISDVSELNVDYSQYPMLMNLDNSYHEDLVALARNLDNKVSRIVEYVSLNIKTELYYGIKKGAVMTLHDGAGNDYDKVNLCIELCKAAGLPSNAFCFYKCSDFIPILRTNESYSLESLTGLNVSNGNFNYLLDKLGGIPYKISYNNNVVVGINILRIKLALATEEGIKFVDLLQNNASFVSGNFNNINLSNILTAAAGTISGSQILNVNENNLFKELNLQSYNFKENISTENSLETYIGKIKYSKYLLPQPQSSTLEQLYGYQNASSFYAKINNFDNKPIIYKQLRVVNNQITFGYFNNYDAASTGATLAVLYQTIPQQDYSNFKIEVKNNNKVLIGSAYSMNLSDLNSRRLWLSFNGNTANLRFETDTPIVSRIIDSSGGEFYIKFSIQHAYDIYSSTSTLTENANEIYFNENVYKKMIILFTI